MRALVWNGPRQMEIKDLAIPKPKSNEVLIKVHSVGIWGSQLPGILVEIDAIAYRGDE